MPITQSSRRKNDFFLLEDWCELLRQQHTKVGVAIPNQEPRLQHPIARKDQGKKTKITKNAGLSSPASAYPLACKRSNSRDRCRGHHARGPYVSRLRLESQ
jgi:hypothetical protein